PPHRHLRARRVSGVGGGRPRELAYRRPERDTRCGRRHGSRCRRETGVRDDGARHEERGTEDRGRLHLSADRSAVRVAYLYWSGRARRYARRTCGPGARRRVVARGAGALHYSGGSLMNRLHSTFVVFITAAAVVVPAAQTKKPGPLTLKEQGSFFVGGENKKVTQPGFGPNAAPITGEITVNQMYVQYQIPMKGDQHVPVVMVHGCCLSSKTWETTPDGRMGWSEYFVRKDRPVYLADQVSRARSGFDPTTFADVRQGKTPPGQMPTILDA